MSQIKVELQDSMGNDKAIALAAWTSSTEYQVKKLKTNQQVKDLVNRLANEKHATPFESVVFRFWIKLPIAIDRQHLTHRIASHNGMSGRYRTMPSEYLELPEDCDEILDKIDNGQQAFEDYYKVCETANSLYTFHMSKFKEAKNAGNISNDEYKRLREIYRGILPQHNMTERVTVINLRSFVNYQRLRNSSYAQKEIKEIAELMLECVEKANVCPIAIESLKNNNWLI